MTRKRPEPNVVVVVAAAAAWIGHPGCLSRTGRPSDLWVGAPRKAMAPGLLVLAAAAILAPPPAIAQELPTTQLQDHGNTVLHGAMTRSMLRANRGNTGRRASNRQIARDKCATETSRARAGGGNPVLLRMCTRAGLR
jgi:hypothetical protein